jgi:hypothetical protein
VRDLKLGEGLAILNDPDELVVRVVQPSAARAEEELATDTVEGEAAAEGDEDSNEDD